jgi:hypothetical protein
MVEIQGVSLIVSPNTGIYEPELTMQVGRIVRRLTYTTSDWSDVCVVSHPEHISASETCSLYISHKTTLNQKKSQVTVKTVDNLL